MSHKILVKETERYKLHHVQTRGDFQQGYENYVMQDT